MTNLSDLYPSDAEGAMPSYINTRTYPAGAIINYNGTQYKSLVDDNLGNQPDTSPDAWQEYLYDAARLNYEGNQGMLVLDGNIQFVKAASPVIDGMTMTIGNDGLIELQQTGDTAVSWSDSDSTAVTLTTVPAQLLAFTLDQPVAAGEGSYAVSGKIDNTDNKDRDLTINIYRNTTLIRTGVLEIPEKTDLYMFSFTGALETALSVGDEIKVEFAADKDNELVLRGDVYTTVARVKKVVSTALLVLLGNNNSVQTADRYRWNDAPQMLIGMRLDVNNGTLDYDYADKGIKFPDSTGITADGDKLHFSYELGHDYKLDGTAHPHIHWLQTGSDRPNWLFRWRIWKNGEDAGPWTNIKVDTDRYPAPAAGARKIQISHGTYIDLAPHNLEVSDFLELELCRDTANDSGLFAGTDPVSGDVVAKAFAPHLQITGFGSKLEWSV